MFKRKPEAGDLGPAAMLCNQLSDEHHALALARYVDNMNVRCQICGGALFVSSLVHRRVWYADESRNYLHAEPRICLEQLHSQLSRHVNESKP